MTLAETGLAPGSQPTGPLLEVVDLETIIKLRTATVHAVDKISFSVSPGETVGVVGESGCGKTMTGLSIMRLLPNGGHIVGGQLNFNGRDLASLDEETMRGVRGNEIGMVFQDPMTSLNPTMTIGHQISESVRLHRGATKAAGLERAVEVLDLVGMPKPRERVNDFPHQLSGGLRQRVMIAMALACDPKLLIADEPTTALDVTIQAQILSLLDDLKSKLGMAMILITHDLGVIAGRADRVIVMYAGRIVEMAGTYDLFARMRHPYTEALLASIPQLDQDTSQRLYSIPGLPPDLTNPPTCCRFSARCSYVKARCLAEDPHLEPVLSTHPAACFFPRATSAAEIAGSGDLIPVVSLKALSEAERLAVTGAAETERQAAIEEAATAAGTATSTSTGTSGGTTATVSGAHGAVAGGPVGEEVLKIDHVSKEFVVTAGAVLQRKVGILHAVTDVSLTLTRGETLGIVGESGCGKTTLGRMVVALEKPTSGQIVFDGTDMASLSSGRLRHVRRDLQMMFQDPYASLDPRMRVGSIVEEPLIVQHLGDHNARKEKVRELLAVVGLPTNAVDRYPHEFSGGQRQRIGLARALALQPKIIVADEPVSALDVSIRSQILNLMKGLQATHGLTYIFISHDLSVVRYLADRIGVMYLGKLVELGTGDDIYARPAHPYTVGLLATIPVPKPEIERAKHGSPIKGELPSPINPPSGCRFRTRCWKAQEICAAQEPPLVDPPGLGHQVACHFPEMPVI